MKLIVGLGNIGAHFEGTRHNIGFELLDDFANQNNIDWLTKDRFKASVTELTLNDEKVVLAKPTTYYNLTGEAVRALKDFYKLKNSDILIVHDELALPFGTVRTRTSGSDAGNNGMKSIIANVGEDISRIRIGTSNEHTSTHDASDFVLSQLTHEERQKLPEIKKEALSLIRQFIAENHLPHTSVGV